MAKNCGCGRRVFREGEFLIRTSCPQITLEIIKKENMCFQVKGIVLCNTVPLESVNVNLSSSSNSIVKPHTVCTDKTGAFSSEVNLLTNSIKEIEVTATVISNKLPVKNTININI